MLALDLQAFVQLKKPHFLSTRHDCASTASASLKPEMLGIDLQPLVVVTVQALHKRKGSAWAIPKTRARTFAASICQDPKCYRAWASGL